MMNYQRLSDTVSLHHQKIDRRNTEIPWWIKIITAQPRCIYYFGPFNSKSEAKELESGYVEDLISEKAQGIGIEIEQAHPQLLTITET